MTETPKFTVIKQEEKFEIRHYLAFITAEVEIKGISYRSAVYKGFNVLAGYIFGNNIKKEKIAMTSPVTVADSQKIAMTKPVTISSNGTYRVGFIMPEEYTLDTLPVPKDGSVQLSSQPAHNVGVIKFNGYFGEEKIDKYKNRLAAWLKKEGIETEGNFIIAGYNPPWVPWFLARNEVMIKIKT